MMNKKILAITVSLFLCVNITSFADEDEYVGSDDQPEEELVKDSLDTLNNINEEPNYRADWEKACGTKDAVVVDGKCVPLAELQLKNSPKKSKGQSRPETNSSSN